MNTLTLLDALQLQFEFVLIVINHKSLTLLDALQLQFEFVLIVIN